MATRWAGRARRRRPLVAADLPPGAPERTDRSEPCDAADAQVIDLRDSEGCAATEVEVDPAAVAELAARFKARAARAEAQRDLERLRARHWSGERLIEEACTHLEWWDHPEADPYAVLGLLPGASLEEAASARRHIAHLWHPDRLGAGDDPAADDDPDLRTRRMVAANAAYDRLRRALRPI